MYHENKLRIHQIIFLICCIFYVISPSYNQNIVQAKSKEKTSTGVEGKIYAPVQSSGEIYRKKEKQLGRSNTGGLNNSSETKMICGVDCKVDKLIEIGIIPEIAESLVTNCKALASDPRKCVLVGASIVVSESSGGKNCRKNNQYNCFGIMQNNNYKSYNDATLHFAGKFQKWWHKAESMSFFYPPAGQVSKSRFCTSEDSSGSNVGCPNGLRNSSVVFNKLNKLF